MGDYNPYHIEVKKLFESDGSDFKSLIWNDNSFEKIVRRILHIGSSVTGLSQRIVKPDAKEKLIEIWENCEIEGEKPDVEEIERLIKEFSPEKIKKPDSNYWVRLSKQAKFIRPGWYAEALKKINKITDAGDKLCEKMLSKDEEISGEFKKIASFKTLEYRLKNALWATPPSPMNPFYEMMKRHFPILDLLNRLTYLKALWEINENKENKENKDSVNFKCCLDLSHKMIKLAKFGFLVCGAIWKAEDLRKSNSDKRIEFLIEEKIKTKIEELEKLVSCMREREEFSRESFPVKRENELSNNQKLFLLTRGSKFDLVTNAQFKKKIELLTDINLLTIAHLSESFIRKQVYTFDGELVFLTTMVLFFVKDLVSDMSNLICKENKRNFLWKDKSKKKPEIRLKLVYNGPPKVVFLISLRGKWNNNKFVLNDFREIANIDILLKQNSLDNKKETDYPVSIEIENKQELQNIFDTEFFLEKVKILFENFWEKRKKSYSHIERFYFDKVRDKLQSIEENNVFERIKFFVKGAMVLCLADYGTYVEYDSLNDVLVPVFIHKSFLLKLNSFKGFDYLSNIEKTCEARESLKKELKEWAQSNERNKSSAYQCLDKLSVISRFSNEQKDIFASKEENIIHSLLLNHRWFQKENDILAIPVLSHGRIQGILHLSSAKKKQFTYENRVSLIEYVQQFEEEIFEARFVRYEERLNEILKNALIVADDSTFLKNILEETGKLLSFNYIAFWKKEGDKIKLEQQVGQEKVFKNKEIPFNEFEKLTKKEKVILEKDLEEREKKEKSYFIVDDGILRIRKMEIEPEFFLVCFNKINENAGVSFEKELTVIADRISQLLGHYLEHNKQLEEIKAFVAHDLSGSLFGLKEKFHVLNKETLNFIENIKKLIKEKNITVESLKLSEKAHKFEMWFQDIEDNIFFSNELLSIFSGKETSSNVEHVFRLYSPIYGKYKASKVNVFKVITAKFLEVGEKLRKKKIMFSFGNIKEMPQLWLVEEALKRVIGNLANNVVKYGVGPSSVRFWYEKTDLFFKLHIRNIGFRLCEEGEENPQIVFEKRKQCTKKENRNGELQGPASSKGMGLYIAKELCKTWGGDLTLNYEILDGSKASFDFVLDFPVWLNSESNPWE